ncbi:MAG: hypothetical protein OEY43_00875 [Gammaproteobacteria bacterium]|nr:hypothetical protein [Gammaproteobacteria bacterium]
MKKLNLLGFALCLVLSAFKINAATYNFNCITANDPSGTSCGIAEAQMSVDVNDAGSNQVEFIFSNTGPDTGAFIADIYFYDGPLFGNYTMTASSGVSFTSGATPGHLPAYSPEATVSLIYSADSDAPVAANGIQSGEWLSVVFDLQTGITYADILNAMDIGSPDGLVVGIHAQGLNPFLNDDGTTGSFSESLITVVPVPAALVLFMSGLIGMFGFAQRKRS